MKTTISRIYTFLAFLTLLGCLGFTAWDLWQRSNAAQTQAQLELRTVAGHLTDLYIQAQSFPSKPLRDYLGRLTGQTRWVSFALGSDREGLEYYRGPAPSDNLPARPAPSAIVQIPALTSPTWLQTAVSLEVYVPNIRTYTLKGLYQIFTPAELWDLSLRLLLALATLLLVSVAVFFLTREQTDEAEADEEMADDDAPWARDEDQADDDTPDFELNAPAMTDTNDRLAQRPLRTESAEPADEYWFDDQEADGTDRLRMEDLPPLDAATPPRSTPSPVTPTPQPLGDSPAPFNPRSGMTWGNFLTNRLDFELERCASFNQDLTLILISCPEILVRPDEAYVLLGEAVSGYWQFKDLDFEYNDEGFAILNPNVNLEATIRDLSEFTRKLERRLPQYHLYCGLSSRNGRLIESSTILKEAQKALEKAKTSHDHIIGFRSDPDRYRQYLASGAAG